jgi:hypothetical protein
MCEESRHREKHSVVKSYHYLFGMCDLEVSHISLQDAERFFFLPACNDKR